MTKEDLEIISETERRQSYDVEGNPPDIWHSDNKLWKNLSIAGVLALSLYLVPALPGTNNLPIFNLPRKCVKNQFKCDYLEGKILPGFKNDYHSPEISMETRTAVHPNFIITYPVFVRRNPLLEGITDEEFCEIVDNYDGLLDYASMTKYVREQKINLYKKENKLIQHTKPASPALSSQQNFAGQILLYHSQQKSALQFQAS